MFVENLVLTAYTIEEVQGATVGVKMTYSSYNKHLSFP